MHLLASIFQNYLGEDPHDPPPLHHHCVFRYYPKTHLPGRNPGYSPEYLICWTYGYYKGCGFLPLVRTLGTHIYIWVEIHILPKDITAQAGFDSG